ncbi:hypothetical protein [Olleya sp. Bg11-27]|uniref:hypothetical protein n=1 Tax=Olleya sp. Bg11-27 TaxID=2058135 RepID=UPI000C31A860|nr:hypothetical protein [Olleya sp. Bg11-27]AUC76956.1 hypothetical protein CW732_15235 [Olleya sp. Bg11-27]
MNTKKEATEKMELDFPVKYNEALNSKMKTSFWKCNDDSHINSALHYYLEIPNNIKPTSLIEKNIKGIDNIKEIASYRRIDENPYVEIQVVYQKLEHEINPSDWLYNLLKITNETIVDKREIVGNAGIYLDVLSSKVLPNSETVISRSTAQKNYDQSTKTLYIVSVKVSCSLKDYPTLSEEIMAISLGWNFINKSKYQLSEDLKIFNEEKAKDLNFYYPVSWKLGKFIANEDNIERFAIFNKNKKGESKGAINIFISENEKDEKTLLDKVIKRFLENGVKVEVSNLESCLNNNDFIEKRWKTTGLINQKESLHNGEITFEILKTKKSLILLEMVGVNEEYDYYESARNKRTLQLISQTLKTSDKISSVEIEEEKPQKKKKSGFFDFLG